LQFYYVEQFIIKQSINHYLLFCRK